MSKKSFKIDKSLVLRPGTAPTDPENGELYLDSITGKINKYEKGVWTEVDPEVITNKDIGGGTASDTNRLTAPNNTTTVLDSLTPKEGVLAYDTDRKSLVVNDGSVWSTVGGGGSGGINYIKNEDFEAGAIDTASTANVTVGLETTDPIRGAQSLKLTIATGATIADYAEIDMNDVDNFDLDGTKDLYVSFDYYTDANYTTDDVQFVMRRVDATAADIPIRNEFDGKLQASTNKVRFQGVVTPDSDANTYTLRANVLVAPGTASNIRIDNVKIGPSAFTVGYNSTGWMPYTPTFTGFGTTTNVKMNYKRSGDTIEIQGTFTAGTTTATIAEISLPSGLTIDFAKTSTLTNSIVGRIARNAISGNNDHFAMITNGSDNIRISASDSPSVGFEPLVAKNANTLIATGEIVVVTGVKIPITEWTNSSVMSTNELSLQTVRVRATSNSGEVITGTVTPISFTSTEEDTHSAWSGTVFTAPHSGSYRVSAHVYTNSISSYIFLYKNGVVLISGGSVAVSIFKDFNSTIKLAKGDTLEVRSNTGVTLTNSSLHHTLQIDSIPDFTVLGVVRNNELVEANSDLITYPITVNQWGDVTSISLGAGEWDVEAHAIYRSAATVTTTIIQLGVSTTSGNVSPTRAKEHVSQEKTTANAKQDSMTVSRVNYVFGSTTTLYLKAYAGNSIANLQIAYAFTARRIK